MVASPETDIRVSFSMIRGYEVRRKYVLIPLAKFSPPPPPPQHPPSILLSSSDSLPVAANPVSQPAFFFIIFSFIFELLRSDSRSQTANQAKRTRHDYRNGLNWPGRLNRDSKQQADGRSNSRYLSGLGEKENRVGARPTAFLMWPSVQAMNLSCVNRSLPLSLPPPLLPLRSSTGPLAGSPLSDRVSLLRNPSESTLRVISQQNLSIAGGNVFQQAVLPPPLL